MIKLLILDVDGVMTDGIKYYDREGVVRLKTFCDKDWTAIKRFRAIGVDVVFLTGDPYNISILENRNLHVIANRGSGFHSDKKNYLDAILDEYKCTAKETAYVGDDLFDLGIMKRTPSLKQVSGWIEKAAQPPHFKYFILPDLCFTEFKGDTEGYYFMFALNLNEHYLT